MRHPEVGEFVYRCRGLGTRPSTMPQLDISGTFGRVSSHVSSKILLSVCLCRSCMLLFLLNQLCRLSFDSLHFVHHSCYVGFFLLSADFAIPKSLPHSLHLQCESPVRGARGSLLPVAAKDACKLGSYVEVHSTTSPCVGFSLWSHQLMIIGVVNSFRLPPCPLLLPSCANDQPSSSPGH